MKIPFSNPCGRLFWICLAIGLASLLAATGASLFLLRLDLTRPVRDSVTLLAFFAGAGSLGALTSAFLFRLVSQRILRRVRQIETGDYLVRWTYSPEEWEAFQSQESPLLKRDFWNTIAVPVLIGIPFGLALLALQVFSQQQPDLKGLVFTGIATALFLALLLSVAYYTRVIRRRSWNNAQKASPPESILHPDFAYANGEFLFGIYQQQLISVQKLSSAPSRIEFCVKTAGPRGSDLLETRRILIPVGQESKADDVIAALRQAWHLH